MDGRGLRSLGGALPPSELAGDIGAISLLPDAARQALWSALGPSLPNPLPSEAEAALDAFCKRYSVDPDHLGLVVRACRFVVRAATARGLSKELLIEDLRSLTEDAQVIAVVASGYEEGRRLLGERALKQALDVHGESLKSVDFRIDHIQGTRDVPTLDAFVAHLALEVGRGEERRTLSFQADLAAIGALRDVCDEIQRRARQR